MFTSLVHENRSITDIERFHYLVSCLSGSALNIVKSVPLTSDNYVIAWCALRDRYDNKRLLATAHCDKLFSFERLQRESVSSLSSFVNTFRENVAALKALGVVDLSGFLLFYIGARVIDPDTRRLFEASVPQESIPKLDELLDFAANRCKILENVGANTGTLSVGNSSSRKGKGGQTSVKTSLSTTATAKNKCAFCDRDHPLFRCLMFKRKSVAERREFVIKKELCFVCLRPDHEANSCKSAYLCKTCEGRHSVLLHLDSKHKGSGKTSTPNTMAISKPIESTTDQNCTATNFSGAVKSDVSVVLATAIVRIRDQSGELVPVRALLDTGSQISAITNQCAIQLGLPRHKGRVEVSGLAQQPVRTVKGSTNCSFIPLLYDAPQISATNIVILPKITALMPNQKLPISIRERYGHLPLADPDFDVPGSVDMLIGGDLYPFILQSRSDIVHSPGLPSALNTQFGWVIVGAIEGSREYSTASSLVVHAASDNQNIGELLQRFWEVEELDINHSPSTEDEACERHFQETVSRDCNGRFHVALPFKSIISSSMDKGNTKHDAHSLGLGSSRALALNRLYNLERRLSKDEELYNAYRDFMDEYIALGHMKLAERTGEYFIPHHAVVKRKENDIKIRVVFDASAPSSSGRSLNDCLATGSKLQTDIGDILLRCRFYKYIFIADIVKMYRQIFVRKEDRVYQHILWRRSPHEQVQEYELCTVTYGINSAPFLAIRCLLQLEQDNGPEFPLARQFLRSYTYVDDIIAGADTREGILKVQCLVVGLFQKDCFQFSKWASNCPEVLEGIAKEDCASNPYYEPHSGLAIKILGLYWDPYGDTFGYRSNITEMQPTKRSVLSVLARLYDPIGTLGPMVFWAKCLMQELWRQGLNWDTPISNEISSKWNMFIEELTSLAHLKLLRHISIGKCIKAQLVGFADASQRGYAATVFLRVTDNQGIINVYFIACKSKVAPLKTSKIDKSLTIPRLELCAALLLARLLSHKMSLLKELVSVQSIKAFSDSTIALSWLKAEPKDFKIFVTNRVNKIKELLPQCEWNHVKTTENAADPASRGLLPSQLVASALHLNGPEFLRHPEEQWSSQNLTRLPSEQLPDYKQPVKCVLHILKCKESEEIFRRFSSLTRMQRTLAYVWRLIDRFKRRPVSSGPLTQIELNRTLLNIIKLTQNFYWEDLRKQLENTSASITPNSLAQLSPYLDKEELIRVGGRLRFSLLTEEAKHPVLLPKAGHVTQLIIIHYHMSLLHAGPKLVMAMIQRKYWIVSGRAAIRKIIHTCVRCVRHRAACPQPVMADLPPVRVQPHRPFAFVGMDYGGPFIVKESRRRGAKTNKAYLALFVCLSVKAVHLEVVKLPVS
ncbi:unnamed protein product [Aphis gossypii]|uniref:Integrase zinc-binding domain-containing protein n=1 Tax=Aphis gossypii TaxID=80765 RepID=A0A9P0J1Y6_APHGO|nr:unnamed protein product [Aphis gossypii]